MKIQSLNLLVACLLSFGLAAPSQAQITGPEQPSSGPGGSSYSHASVVQHDYGTGDLQYWLFEPAAPKPESAPVVIFNHGWSAMTPGGYRAWIDHIVRRGNIVIYPRFQATLRTKASEFCSNDIRAVKAALEELQSGKDHVRPQLDKIAVVGHSAGGQISAGIAARAATSGLPPIKAVMCVEPGKTWGPHTTTIPLEDVSTIPSSTLLLAVVGDHDTVVRDIDAVKIINGTTNVPAQNKNLVTLVSDTHGQPQLIANHFCPAAPSGEPSSNGAAGATSDKSAEGGPLRQMLRARIMQRLREQNESAGTESSPQAPRGINALDYYGTWKLFDALQEAALYNKDREFALGNTPQQRYMGKWSDGQPVKELVVEVGHADPNLERIKVAGGKGFMQGSATPVNGLR